MKVQRYENKMSSNPSPMLQAVMDQSKYTDEEASRILASIEEKKADNVRKAREQLLQPQEIAKHTYIPSAIKPENINQKHEVHPHFKNYDHSLEQVRIKFNPEGTDSDGIEFGDMTSKDVL